MIQDQLPFSGAGLKGHSSGCRGYIKTGEGVRFVVESAVKIRDV